jgi:hypothetical protein
MIVYMVVTLFDAAHWQVKIYILVHCFGGGRRKRGTDKKGIKKGMRDEGTK